MSPVHLNRRLVLEGPVKLADGAGGFSQGWTVLGQMWADVTARTGRQRAEAGAPVSAVAYRIIVRAAPLGAAARPRPAQRFRDGARRFVIQAVAEHDPGGRYLICFAQEEVAA
jgi:head-tail adaptor